MARTEALRKAQVKYEANHKLFAIRFSLGVFAKLQEKAEERNTSCHRLILNIVEDWLEKN